MSTIIIGLLGPAGAGKSSVAGYLAEQYGAVRYSLAAPLKEIAMRTLDLSHEQCWGTQAQKEADDPRYGFSPRWFLQRLGTEGIRHVFGPDVWTRLCLEKIAADQPLLAVVEDVRFVNEAKIIRGLRHGNITGFGYVWRLECPARETAADGAHASESEWVKAPHDYVVAPAERGLPLLFSLIDDACRSFKIFPKRRELAQ